jgi:hypothetical protein
MQSHQNSNDIYHRGWKINPKVHMEPQKTVNAKAMLSKKNNLEVSQYMNLNYTTEPHQ